MRYSAEDYSAVLLGWEHIATTYVQRINISVHNEETKTPSNQFLESLWRKFWQCRRGCRCVGKWGYHCYLCSKSKYVCTAMNTLRLSPIDLILKTEEPKGLMGPRFSFATGRPLAPPLERWSSYTQWTPILPYLAHEYRSGACLMMLFKWDISCKENLSKARELSVLYIQYAMSIVFQRSRLEQITW